MNSGCLFSRYFSCRWRRGKIIKIINSGYSSLETVLRLWIDTGSNSLQLQSVEDKEGNATVIAAVPTITVVLVEGGGFGISYDL